MTPYRFSPEEIRLALSIAGQAAIALHTALLTKSAAQYLEELEERNRELDAYAYTIAHDLKNPINMILNYAEITRVEYAEVLDEQADEFLSRVVESGLKMAKMIDNLLELAKVGNVVASAEPVAMNAPVQAALLRFADLIDTDKVSVSVADLPTALGHEPWVEEIFANLIGNALKYMGDDNPEPSIWIRGTRIDDNSNRYEVQDNGIGIPAEGQTHLFEMFTRLRDNRAQRDGLGLGLSIVQRMVHKMNGTVGVQSEYGQGSTFWFTLPAID